jgi:hypothetical protein
MARQSIVDFVKDARTPPDPASSGMGTVGRVETEAAYAELAQPVLKALSTGTPLSEGELFKRVDANNIAQFRAVIEEMKARGLVRVIALNQPFNDPIYGPAFGIGPD